MREGVCNKKAFTLNNTLNGTGVYLSPYSGLEHTLLLGGKQCKISFSNIIFFLPPSALNLASCNHVCRTVTLEKIAILYIKVD